MRRHLLAIAVILTGATGCDNVDWGGSEWSLVPPPSTVPDTLLDAALPEEEPERVFGPLLLAGTRDGPRATLAVVGEVQGEGLVALGTEPEEVEHLEAVAGVGSEWTLFADGVRVGTLAVDEVGNSAGYCPARRTVSGVVELVPSASAEERLLALPATVGGGRAYDPFTPLEDDYDQRVATLTWAGDAIPRNEATYPPNGLVQARQEIHVFQPVGAPGPAVAATFMYRDRLAIAPAPQGAYALFVLGAQRGGAYAEDFAWYRPVGEGGKGAPRFFDHLDWDGDGDAEILLEVLGAERRWFAVLGRRGNEWVRTFQDACGTGPLAGG